MACVLRFGVGRGRAAPDPPAIVGAGGYGRRVERSSSPSHERPPSYPDRVRGCLLGGAIGDALGAPVEFRALPDILGKVGDAGVRDYLPAAFGPTSGVGLITDDTQMTMFIAEGIIRARVREDRGLGFTVAVTDHALRRWLDTQHGIGPTGTRDGWLQSRVWLYSRRAPGNTCLNSLAEAPDQFGHPARNESKGCGAVMRSAPFGLLGRGESPERCYELARVSAGYTHGHPTGQIAAGALAAIIAHLTHGASMEEACRSTLRLLRGTPDHDETSDALAAALAAVERTPRSTDAVHALGGGWVADEAIAIAVYCALSFPHADATLDALSLAVTHSGDSDSTGAICGNLLGTAYGANALPPGLVFQVEGRGDLLELADDFVLEETQHEHLHGDWGPHTGWVDRYPGW